VCSSDLKKENVSNNTSTSNQTDYSVNGVGEGAIAASGGSSITQYIQSTDQGALKTAGEAFKSTAQTLNEAINANAAGVKLSLAMASGLGEKAIGLGDTAMTFAAQAGRDALAANKATQEQAFAFTARANDAVAKTALEAVGMSEHITAKNADLAQLAISQVKGAWSDAQQANANQAGGDYRMLMWALAAVVAMVAVRAFKG
jgi:hypothetical protein